VLPPSPYLFIHIHNKLDFFIIVLIFSEFIKNHSNQPVFELVQSGLTYLDTRTEFWRQQRPLYARKKGTLKSHPRKKKKTKQSIGRQVLKVLEEIDQGIFFVFSFLYKMFDMKFFFIFKTKKTIKHK